MKDSKYICSNTKEKWFDKIEFGHPCLHSIPHELDNDLCYQETTCVSDKTNKEFKVKCVPVKTISDLVKEYGKEATVTSSEFFIARSFARWLKEKHNMA